MLQIHKTINVTVFCNSNNTFSRVLFLIECRLVKYQTDESQYLRGEENTPYVFDGLEKVLDK